MKKTILLLLFPFMVACVTPTGTEPSPSMQPSSQISQEPVSTPTPSVSPSVAETPQPTPSPGVTPVPSPTVILPIKKAIISTGLGQVYRRIAEQLVEDTSREAREINEIIVEASPEFIIIDLEQKLVDPDLDAEDIDWAIYKRILDDYDSSSANSPKIIFRIAKNLVLSESSQPSLKNYQKFIEEVIKRFDDQIYGWVIGNRVNDPNALSVPRVKYLDFLEISHGVIKRLKPEQKIYMGSILQAEVFGQSPYLLADDFLSFINLGAADFCDGFIFEINSFYKKIESNKVFSIFDKTDYKLPGSYYPLIQEVLQLKNITDKKILLSTATFGGGLVDSVSQSEEIQGIDLIKRFVSAYAAGFDQVFPQYLSEVKYAITNDTQDFYDRIGLIKREDFTTNKKDAYWAYKFINQFNGAVYQNKIEDLPAGFDGYHFIKNNKKYYILWNEDEDFAGNVVINIGGSQGKIMLGPTPEDELGSEFNFNLGGNSHLNISFFNYPLTPRVVEVE